jgi:hypothetical protein
VREEYPHIAINQKLSKTLTETLTNNDEDAKTNQKKKKQSLNRPIRRNVMGSHKWSQLKQQSQKKVREGLLMSSG